MTNQQQPITPPPELLGQWLCSDDYLWGPLEQTSMTITTNRLQNVATKAAQWGADQELEACSEWLDYNCPSVGAHHLLAARRPKPPSLKEQAPELVRRIEGTGSPWALSELSVIRRALEALDD